MAHLIQRVTILGTGLIGGSFAWRCANMRRTAHRRWDRAEVVQQARKAAH